MRRNLWFLLALLVTAGVVGLVLTRLRDLAPEAAGPGIAINGTIVYEANGNIRMVNPDVSHDGA